MQNKKNCENNFLVDKDNAIGRITGLVMLTNSTEYTFTLCQSYPIVCSSEKFKPPNTGDFMLKIGDIRLILEQIMR